MPSTYESKPIPRSVFAVLRAYLAARATFSEDDFSGIEAAFLFKHLSTAEFLQRAGDIPRYAVFVASGCLRNYVIDAKGKEHIVQFAPETWWLADSVNIKAQTPSPYFIDAIENSDLLLIDEPSHQKIIEQVPAYSQAFRAGLQRHASTKDQRIVSSLSASAEERYLEFLNVYPSIVRRVPQLMLASYLGMTPETLSRIRKKLSRK
ncbi:MAG TPA: Crp/Fnr family transcriptional regulator [Terriglobales bacterium]|nr:Crp/Fnr family transcriptional regulator [Terriglobales bacterium]